jgi:hypothetical protein
LVYKAKKERGRGGEEERRREPMDQVLWTTFSAAMFDV